MHIDLGQYQKMLAAHQQRIGCGQTQAQALQSAAAFLDEAGAVLGQDVATSFHAEVDYLWAIVPARRQTFEKYQEIINVLVGQTLDACWYAAYPTYRTIRDVVNDRTLRSFRRFAPDFRVRFGYVQYYGHPLMRIPNSLRLRYRRLLNHPGKYTQGLTITRCKKATAALINELSEAVAQEIETKYPFKLLVNSVLRTADYQHALASLGYVAPRNSSHLAGYAVDVEQWWYYQHNRRVHNAIQSVLDQLFNRNVINVIDERTHWHVCLNPRFIPYFEDLFQKWERTQPRHVWNRGYFWP